MVLLSISVFGGGKSDLKTFFRKKHVSENSFLVSMETAAILELS